MTDRELLEQAAKAAGIKFEWQNSKTVKALPLDVRTQHTWNPLMDSGDATSLAIKLRMGIHYEMQFLEGKDFEIVEVYHSHADDGLSCKVVAEIISDNAYAATRRAIVRAAAEIGKAKEEAENRASGYFLSQAIKPFTKKSEKLD